MAAYLGLPDGPRRRLQPLVKATAADAHPLVGACNDPAAIRAALVAAGFTDIRLTTVGHLARAWGRHWPTFALGLVGDLLTDPVAVAAVDDRGVAGACVAVPDDLSTAGPHGGPSRQAAERTNEASEARPPKAAQSAVLEPADHGLVHAAQRSSWRCESPSA